MIEIKPDKFYSATSLIKGEAFPWMKSVMPFIDMLNTEKGREIFKPIIRIGKRGDKRYFIKGSNVIEVNRLAEQGLLNL